LPQSWLAEALYLADRGLHTSPALAIVGGFLGFASGIWEVINRLTREQKSEETNEEKNGRE